MDPNQNPQAPADQPVVPPASDQGDQQPPAPSQPETPPTPAPESPPPTEGGTDTGMGGQDQGGQQTPA